MHAPPLLEQNLLWIVPYALLMLLMVHAMMEFTVSLLVKRAPARRDPASAAELRQRLQALSETLQGCRLVEGQDCDLEVVWDLVAGWRQRFTRVKMTTHYRVRLLLDEPRLELRVNEYLRSSNFFLGFDGWVPRFNWNIFFFSGFVSGVWAGRAYNILPGFPPRIGEVSSYALDTGQVKHEISRIANRSGWTFRPVIWWFEATRSGLRLARALTPAPLRALPARRFWGATYLGSYLLGMGYIIAAGGLWDAHNLLVIAGISAIWWGIWGLLVWALLGFPALQRRRK